MSIKYQYWDNEWTSLWNKYKIKEEIWIQNDEAISSSHLLHNALNHGIGREIDTGLAGVTDSTSKIIDLRRS